MTTIEQIFADVNGATFVSIDTLTPVALTGGKSNPMAGRITKVQQGSNVIVFQNKKINGYEAMVRRRLEQENKDPTTFVVSPRTWGIRRNDSPFVDYNGKLYLEVIFLNPGKVVYLLDHRPINRSDIIGLPTNNQANQGDLTNKVIIRTFDVANIKRVTINRVTYDL